MSLVELVLRRALQHPTRLAASDESGALTYAAVASRVRRIASGLTRRGVVPGDCVAVLASRNATLPSVLLGIQAAGAAYVPLDGLYPVERLRFMLDDAQVRLVVADVDTIEIAEALGAPVLGVTDLLHGRDASQAHTPTGLDPSSLAYVIYTSGSTGTPKGVEIPHGALTTFAQAAVQHPGIAATDCVLAATTICFDISILELLVPLTVGARVHVAPAGLLRDGGAVAQLLGERGITVMQATPTAWRLLIESDPLSLRGVRAFCGGEPLTGDLADALLERGAELWNLYGPTEATVWCSASRITAPDAITIGTPLPGYALHVIDGELCIEGALACGYRNRPALTDERFITRQVGSREQRLYRSGDLGRAREDGTFECLGRSDLQVKVDGYRIELGEIEHVLADHAAVRQAFVTVESAANDSRQLVAYVQLTAHATPDDLRAALADRLPAYMVPTHYRELVDLPLTGSGKVDRKRLHRFSRPMASRDAYTLPRTTSEHRLLAIWQELLGRTDFGVDDDYFALGGRSITAARLFARIEQVFGRRLPIATLLNAATVATLAQVIDAPDVDAWAPLVCLRTHGAGAPLFLVHPAGGNVVTYRWLVEALPSDRPIFGLQAIGLDGHRPLGSIEQMADEYLQEVRRVWPGGPYLLAGASFGGLIAFEMARRLERGGQHVSLLALFDTEYPNVPRWIPRGLMGRSERLRHAVYPHLQRARGHLRALREHGPLGYWDTVIRRSRHAAAIDATDQDGPSGGDGPLPAGLTQVIAANERAERNYWPLPYGGLVTLFRAGSARFSPDRRDWWRNVAAVRDVPVAGTHYTMRTPPHAVALAEALRRELERLDPTGITRAA